MKNIFFWVLAVLALLPAVATAKKSAKKGRVQVEAAAPDVAKFVRDTVRIEGRIENYNALFPFYTGKMLVVNPFTGEELPQVFMIADNGTFATTVPVWCASRMTMGLGGLWFDFYVEPGKRLEVTFAQGVPQFAGDLAQENAEMNAFERTGLSHDRRRELLESTDWQMVLRAHRAVMDDNMRRLDQAFAAGTVSAKMRDFLRYYEQTTFVEDLLYGRNLRFFHDAGDLPVEFYAFMKEMPLDEPGFLCAADRWYIVNRVRYMGPVSAWMLQSATTIYDVEGESIAVNKAYFIADIQDRLSDDERWYITVPWEMLGEDSLVRKRYAEISKTFYPRLIELVKEHAQTRPYSPVVSDKRFRIAFADSVWTALTGRKPGLMMDFVAMNELGGLDADLTPAEIVQIHRAVYDNVEHPFLRDEVWRHYEAMLPQLGNKATELPAGLAADILNGIIGRFRGKPVLVDFWGMSCGPCRATLKENRESRQKVETLGKVALVYISSKRNSPNAEAYEKFVTENALTNNFLITDDEWDIISSMLKFNGIPHYVLFDEQGRILNADYQGHSMHEFLQ